MGKWCVLVGYRKGRWEQTCWDCISKHHQLFLWQTAKKKKTLLQKQQQQVLGASFWQQCYFFCLDLFQKWFKAILFFFFLWTWHLKFKSRSGYLAPQIFVSLQLAGFLSSLLKSISHITSVKSRTQDDTLKWTCEEPMYVLNSYWRYFSCFTRTCDEARIIHVYGK